MARKGIYKGVLQSDLDGGTGTNYVTNLAGIQIINRVTREIYLGKRTNSIVGTGDKSSPYNVATMALFNARLADSATWAVGGVVYLMEDEFTHSGSIAWTLPVGGKLIGGGIGKTILKIDPTVVMTNNGLNCTGTDSALDNDGAYIGYMTVDGNYQNLSNPHGGKINGVVLYGNNTTIERVHHKGGFGTFAAVGDGNTLQESFGLICLGTVGDTNPSHHQKIINCIFSDYKGDYGGAIVTVGSEAADLMSIGAVIDGCEVNDMLAADHVAGDDFSAAHCAGIGSGGGVIQNCAINRTQVGIYNENGRDVKIVNNVLKDIYEIGIHMNPTVLIERLSIVNNTVELRDSEVRRWGIFLSDQDDGVREVHEAAVSLNTVYVKVTGDGANLSNDYQSIFMGDLDNRGCSFIGNKCQYFPLINNISRISADSFSIGNRVILPIGDTDEPDVVGGGTENPNLPDQIGGSEGNVSDIAFSSSWDGDTANAPSKNAVYDVIAPLQQHSSFTPTTVGWYRICVGVSAFGGLIRAIAVYGPQGYTDVEFNFDGKGYGSGPGSVQQLRCIHNEDGKIITKARISSNGDSGMYLDVYIGPYITSPGPIYVYGQGPMMGTLFAFPVAGAVTGGTDEISFDFTKGLGSTYAMNIGNHKVLGLRDTGWAAMTGTPDKVTVYDTSSISLPQLAGRVAALQAALTTHGMLGIS